MGRKKAFLLFVSLVLLLALFANSSFAEEKDSQSLKGAFDTIRQLFAFIPEMITTEKLIAGNDPVANFWAKFLIWLGLFAVMYFGASFVFRQNPRIAVVVALVISLMGALMIPTSIVGSIFQTYGLVAAVFVWVVPAFAGFYLAHVIPNRLVRAGIYLMVLIVLTAINGSILFEDTWNIALPYFTLLWAVVLILFLWNLFAGLGEMGIGPGAPEGMRNVGGFLGRAGRAVGDEFGDAGRGAGGLFGRRGGQPPPAGPQAQAAQAAAQQGLTREQRIEAQQQRLQQVRQRLQNEIQNVRGRELQDLQIIRDLLNELLQIETEIRNILAMRP